MRRVVRQTHVSDPVLGYALALIRATREHPDLLTFWLGRSSTRLLPAAAHADPIPGVAPVPVQTAEKEQAAEPA